MNATMNQADAQHDLDLMREKIARLSSLSAPREGAGIRGGQQRTWKMMSTINDNSEANDGPPENPMPQEEIAAKKEHANKEAAKGAIKVVILTRGLEESVRFCVHADKVIYVRGLSSTHLTVEKARREYRRLVDAGWMKW